MRMNARLTEEEQLEFGRMYNLIRINVAKKTKATKDAFQVQLQAFVVRHGILSKYNEFATLQRPEAKTRDYRLPLFDDESFSMGIDETGMIAGFIGERVKRKELR
ncbi:hypothetical protein E8E11_010350 [Didymella keratinophila]|nr:hypothetical protein E8E11_010350 [Didymella keratinophila]